VTIAACYDTTAEDFTRLFFSYDNSTFLYLQWKICSQFHRCVTM